MFVSDCLIIVSCKCGDSTQNLMTQQGYYYERHLPEFSLLTTGNLGRSGAVRRRRSLQIDDGFLDLSLLNEAAGMSGELPLIWNKNDETITGGMRRLLQTTDTGSGAQEINNPMICLQLNEAIVFRLAIDTQNRYHTRTIVITRIIHVPYTYHTCTIHVC